MMMEFVLSSDNAWIMFTAQGFTEAWFGPRQTAQTTVKCSGYVIHFSVNKDAQHRSVILHYVKSSNCNSLEKYPSLFVLQNELNK